MWVSASPLFRSLAADFGAVATSAAPLIPMNRIATAVLVVSLCIMGASLFYLPWTGIWEQNYFLAHFPSLMRILLHPAVRGLVSGLGILDIFFAVTMIGPEIRSPAQPRVRPQ